jgi:hypothetical protein
MPIMATTTIAHRPAYLLADLPCSRALDYKAMSAIRGAGPGDWVLFAFQPYRAPVAPILPTINFYQTNYIADQLNVLVDNIYVKDSAPGATINIGTTQNALNIIQADPAKPHP